MLKEKLKEKNHTSHFTPRTSNKGITLIALIITIIVMMILVAVTVTFTVGENGILAQAKESAKLAERAQIHEQIMGQIELTNEGKIIVGESYQAAKATLEAQEYTVGDLQDDGTFEVTGKKGTYKYKITETEITVEENIPITLTLNSNGDAIFIGEFEYGYNLNGCKLVYKAEGKTIEILSQAETMINPHLVFVEYKENGQLKKSSALRAASRFYDESGNYLQGSCSHEHYPKGWTDYRVSRVCSKVEQIMGIQQVIEHNVYGVLPESEYPLFFGDWEIDTENSNANGLQYLSNVLIPTTN